MKRVLVIGSSGSGKSTFSKCLSKLTGLPLIHLDQLYWKPDWIEPPKDEWRKIVENVLKSESWIIDGNYSGTLELRLKKCDTVVFLDMSRLTCIYRILKRIVTYRKETRPDMAKGCEERFDWQFIKFVWNYPKRSKPKVERLLAQHQNTKTIFRLKSKREVSRFLRSYESKSQMAA